MLVFDKVIEFLIGAFQDRCPSIQTCWVQRYHYILPFNTVYKAMFATAYEPLLLSHKYKQLNRQTKWRTIFSKLGSYILMHSMHCRGWMAVCWKHLYCWRHSKAAESVFPPPSINSVDPPHTLLAASKKVSCISVRSCKNMILDQST